MQLALVRTRQRARQSSGAVDTEPAPVSTAAVIADVVLIAVPVAMIVWLVRR